MKHVERLILVLSISTALFAGDSPSEKESKKVARGLQISPVSVKTDGAKRSVLGMGSYLVNAASGCANCHTCPTYLPGGKGKNKQINFQNYMAGGVPFAIPASTQGSAAFELRSPNLTPDGRRLPGGLTFPQFKEAVTGGHKPLSEARTDLSPPDEGHGFEIAVMPWRIYQNFEPGDIEAIYEYLKAIPPAKPGTCSGPGQ